MYVLVVDSGGDFVPFGVFSVGLAVVGKRGFNASGSDVVPCKISVQSKSIPCDKTQKEKQGKKPMK